MHHTCSAPGCKNDSSDPECRRKNISFHFFPMDNPRILQLWLKNMKSKYFIPLADSTLCSCHFTEESFKSKRSFSRRLLVTDAVPTIFSTPQKKKAQSPKTKTTKATSLKTKTTKAKATAISEIKSTKGKRKNSEGSIDVDPNSSDESVNFEDLVKMTSQKKRKRNTKDEQLNTASSSTAEMVKTKDVPVSTDEMIENGESNAVQNSQKAVPPKPKKRRRGKELDESLFWDFVEGVELTDDGRLEKKVSVGCGTIAVNWNALECKNSDISDASVKFKVNLNLPEDNSLLNAEDYVKSSDLDFTKSRSPETLKLQLGVARRAVDQLKMYITKLKLENDRLNLEKENFVIKALHNIKQDATNGELNAIILLNQIASYFSRE